MTKQAPSQSYSILLEAIRNVATTMQHEDTHVVPSQRIHNTVSDLRQCISKEGGCFASSLILCIKGALLTGCKDTDLAYNLNHIHTKPSTVAGNFPSRLTGVQDMLEGCGLFASYKYWQAMYANVLYAMSADAFATAISDVCAIANVHSE